MRGALGINFGNSSSLLLPFENYRMHRVRRMEEGASPSSAAAIERNRTPPPFKLLYSSSASRSLELEASSNLHGNGRRRRGRRKG